MKVLWLEISQPSRYENFGHVARGWQDALEDVVRGTEGLELHVAFESSEHTEIRCIDGVTYHPIKTHYSWWEKKRKQWDFSVYANKVVSGAIAEINIIKPDVIHVFGTEWPFGLVGQFVKIPVVVHIQGIMSPCFNALYPPGYNGYTMARGYCFNLFKCWDLWKSVNLKRSRAKIEKRVLKNVRHYMGRTRWDRAFVDTTVPTSTYHHVDEALRMPFLMAKEKWQLKHDSKIILVTTGISNFWKGPEMLLKTAHILKHNCIDFEWRVVGAIPRDLKKVIEWNEGITFEENNVRILGFKQPYEVVSILCSSTIYVHTSYIENSPNSICEAQYLGLPVVSTNVGGIDTLLDGGNDGILVPANDPWRMADAIIKLSKNEKQMLEYSDNGYRHAHRRHNPDNIRRDLFQCYYDIICDSKK